MASAPADPTDAQTDSNGGDQRDDRAHEPGTSQSPTPHLIYMIQIVLMGVFLSSENKREIREPDSAAFEEKQASSLSHRPELSRSCKVS